MGRAQVWSAVGSVAPHRFGWKPFPYAKNIQLFLTALSVLHRVVSAGAMSCRSPAKAVSAFVPHSATALHALAPHGPLKYGVRWEGRSPPHRFGWKPCPCAKNIQPFLTAPSVLHCVVSAGAMSSRCPAKAVSAFVPHSATALHALSPHGPLKYGVRWEAQRDTPLWLETVPICQKHPAVSNSAICPPPCGECRGHELPQPSQSGVGVRASLCHRTPCIVTASSFPLCVPSAIPAL